MPVRQESCYQIAHRRLIEAAVAMHEIGTQNQLRIDSPATLTSLRCLLLSLVVYLIDYIKKS